MADLVWQKDEKNRVTYAVSVKTGQRYEVRRPAELKKYVGQVIFPRTSCDGVPSQEMVVLSYREGEKQGQRQAWDILLACKSALQKYEDASDPDTPKKEQKSAPVSKVREPLKAEVLQELREVARRLEAAEKLLTVKQMEKLEKLLCPESAADSE